MKREAHHGDPRLVPMLRRRKRPRQSQRRVVFRNTRLPVATVIENLEDLSIEGVMEQFDVTREQIEGVLEFLARGPFK